MSVKVCAWALSSNRDGCLIHAFDYGVIVSTLKVSVRVIGQSEEPDSRVECGVKKENF
ncbi:hypothetical protein EGR_05026 [Echinococcus granulosus]|uniref:Uncharacterized protein n=1 Tax=Echinococcus granulosus TaxID=6210 RepID=W6UGR9_ECHGR|nr:hypothetical protein EGR_05026 [Echinococcus granulosus]EUB60173.1 hypothetical protein EGR_05026 [Echinococcus granulosus]